MNSRKKAVLDRIRHLEDAITKAREYLESWAHAQWHGFRPLFVDKVRGGREVPPHRDWVKNVFLPRQERALMKAERILDKLSHAASQPRRASFRSAGKMRAREQQSAKS